MSKALNATCIGGIVTAKGVAVTGTTILSEGIGESEGTLVLDEDRAFYLANTTSDLKTLLEKTIAALGQIQDSLSAIATGPVTLSGASAGPTDTALAATLNIHVNQLNALETELQTLSGSLK